ncbi:MAG: YiiX/YebB-like N1pC/P60 family cysteine hydrolase [Candidatus Berkiellales bacterium]
MKTSFANWFIEKVGHWLLKNEPPRRAYLCHYDQIKKIAEPCDVILIEGRNRISNIIQLITKSPWSHACLYVGRIEEITDPEMQKLIQTHYQGKLDEPLIIESEIGFGTIVSPLSKYQDDHIRLLRPRGLSTEDAIKVIEYAAERLGVKYSTRHVFDLARFLFPWGAYPRRWRSSLFQHNALQPTEDICSSMIADAFQSIQFPILPLVTQDQKKNIELIERNPRLFTPSDFDFSPYFSVIKYPIFNLEDINLSDLPWKKGVISDDRGVLRHLDNMMKKKE